MMMDAVCFDCRYVGARRRRQSVVKRRAFLCRLTGEDTLPTSICSFFQAGNEMPHGCREGGAGLWEKSGQGEDATNDNTTQDKNSTFSLAGKKVLTPGADGVNVKSPNVDSHIWRLAPFAGAKVHTSASNAHDGRAIYWQGNVRMSARLRRLIDSRGALTLPFLF